MAFEPRTIEEIFNEIIAEKETKATLSTLLPAGTLFEDLLNDITSGSKVAIWRLWAYVTAFAIFVHEQQFDVFITDVEIIKSQAIFGTDAFWIQKMFEFQLGDPLIILDIEGVNVPGYEVIDPAKQIIKAAAIVSLGGVSTIKVAKEVASELVALDASELTAVNIYKDQLQPAGVKITVISLNSDFLKLISDIFFDGLLIEAQVRLDVEAAINDHLKNIEFGGVLNRNALIDAVQAVDGVLDIDINTLEGKPNAGIFLVIDVEYVTSAGYIKIDPAFPLSTNLTFVPQ